MKTFIAQHSDRIMGVLSGFDRLVLRGTLRSLAYADGFRSFLDRNSVLLKDFGAFVERTTLRLKLIAQNVADMAGRPKIYLPSAATSKEERARQVLEADGVEAGLICQLSSVEPCSTFEIHRSRERRRLELRKKFGKCLHYYHYVLDQQVGFLNVRLQTWFPFSIQICLNGREWLAQQMKRMEIGNVRRENCFPWIDHIGRAQDLMDQQLCIRWPRLLDRLADEVFPQRAQLLGEQDSSYYWTVHQSEWATDVMFDGPEALKEIYPSLVHYAITSFSSPDVLRFLGKKISPAFRGEITSDFKDRSEGIRVKHQANRNSVKMYDKHGSILRIETTINRPGDFKVYRPLEGDPEGTKEWRPMRKGVADIHRRCQVAQRSNERYLEALAAADTSTPLGELVTAVQKRATIGKSRVRGLRPLDPHDLALLEAVGRGEFVVNGFRNRDLVPLLFTESSNSSPLKRPNAARVTRLLRLLRAHRIIRKVPKTHRYLVTQNGRAIIGALLTARQTPVDQLLALAA